MKRTVMTIVVAIAAIAAMAQNTLKKVYSEDINPMEQIDDAIRRAKADGKYVACQVGGNWCPWCLKFAAFITENQDINKLIADNFVYIHVNYNPRKSAGEEQAAKAAALMERLGKPQRFGFPVIVILDADGNILHTQDSSLLEQDMTYNEKKVVRFFSNWTPKAVEK